MSSSRSFLDNSLGRLERLLYNRPMKAFELKAHDLPISEDNLEYIGQFLENCRNLNKSEHTLINYYADLIKFTKWFESNYPVPLHKIQTDVIGEYKKFLSNGGPVKAPEELYKPQGLDKLTSFFKGIPSLFTKKVKKSLIEHHKSLQGPLSVGSRRRHLSTIKNFFEFLKQTHEGKSKKFKNNPVRPKLHGIKLKDQDINHTVVLRKDDWHKIDNGTFSAKERLATQLLYWGGLRLSELHSLKYDSFDPETKTLKFARKGGSTHTLRPQNVNEIFDLLGVMSERNPSETGHIFVGKSGRQMAIKSLYNLLMKVFLKCGCRPGLTPHSFRKGCATRLYVETKDLMFVRDYLNHSDAKVTQTYIDSGVLAEERSLKSSL